MKARYEIQIEHYSKVLNIEALTMIDVCDKEILPAVCKYTQFLAASANSKKQTVADVDCSYEKALMEKLSVAIKTAFDTSGELKKLTVAANAETDFTERAIRFKNTVIPQMDKLRAVYDICKN